MNASEFDLFLLSTSVLCVLMALMNLVRVKKRGISGYFMAGAFIFVGGALMLFRAKADNSLVGLVGIGAFVFLVCDFAVRARTHGSKGTGK